MGTRRERMTRSIQGALMEAIDAHGPITRENAQSAAKRIAGQIVSISLDDIADRAAVERLHKRYAELKYGHQRALETIDRLRAELAEARDSAAAGLLP